MRLGKKNGSEDPPLQRIGTRLLAAEDAHEFGGREGEASAAAGNEIDVARNVELANLQFLHPAMLDFPLHAHARNDGHAHAHLHKALDAFDGGHFDGHVERGAMAREEFNDAAAKRRFDAVGDESFFSQFSNVNFAFFRKDMFRRNDQGQLVLEDFGGLELGVAWDEGNGAEVETVVQDLVRNVARKHAVNADLDAGMQLTELRERREKSVDGAFVDSERKLAALEAFEFGKAFLDFVAEINEALGVIPQESSGVREADGAGSSDKERLAERVLQLANGQTDGWLSAIKALGSA